MTELLPALTLSTLVATYNNLGAIVDADEIKSFRTKAVAVARVEAMLAKVNEYRTSEGYPLVLIREDGTLGTVEPVAEPTPEPTPEPVAEPKAKPGRAPSFSPSDVIVLLVAGNPKKRTAADRFAAYRTGMAVGEYQAAVGSDSQGSRDLLWDTKQNWVEVVGAAAYAKSQEAQASAA